MGESAHGMGEFVSALVRWGFRLLMLCASADYMQGTRMSFKSKEDAIHFAEKQGKIYSS